MTKVPVPYDGLQDLISENQIFPSAAGRPPDCGNCRTCKSSSRLATYRGDGAWFGPVHYELAHRSWLSINNRHCASEVARSPAPVRSTYRSTTGCNRNTLRLSCRWQYLGDHLLHPSNGSALGNRLGKSVFTFSKAGSATNVGRMHVDDLASVPTDLCRAVVRFERDCHSPASWPINTMPMSS